MHPVRMLHQQITQIRCRRMSGGQGQQHPHIVPAGTGSPPPAFAPDLPWVPRCGPICGTVFPCWCSW
jgi:hypothetical protein